ncbi:WW domain-containing protein [Entamoeba marina]
MASLRININDGSDVIGDTIQGIVSLMVKKPIFVKDIIVYVVGQYNTKECHKKREREPVIGGVPDYQYVTKEVYENVIYEFYHSKEKQLLKEIQGNSKYQIEFPPGLFHYSFKIKTIDNLPSTVRSGMKMCDLEYFLCTKVICHDDTQIFNRKKLTYCINLKRHIPQPTTVKKSDKIADLTVTLSDVNPSVGDEIQLKVVCHSHITQPLKCLAYFISYHHHKTNLIDKTIEMFHLDDKVTKMDEGYVIEKTITLPISFPTTTNIKDYSIKSQCSLSLLHELQQCGLDIPLNIGFDVKSENYLKRSKVFGYGCGRIYRKNHVKTHEFHYTSPPSFNQLQKIYLKQLPNGIEKIETLNDTYYINHFKRSTSSSPNSELLCNYPFPLYNAINLPKGWSIGNSFGEKYFINHETKKTTWKDPRSSQQKIIPHINTTAKGQLNVTIVKAIGLCVLGKNIPDPYIGIIGDRYKWKKTNSYKDKLDIEFEDKNIFEIPLSSTRSNVIIYVFDKYKFKSDIFMGGVNIDLMNFPPNIIIEDWFPLSCFGDKSIPITGKILMRICYQTDKTIDFPIHIINGFSLLDYPYYPKSPIMEEQLEKVKKIREKYDMKESPMIIKDNKVICESI